MAAGLIRSASLSITSSHISFLALMEALIGFWASMEARVASQDQGGFPPPQVPLLPGVARMRRPSWLGPSWLSRADG